MANENPAGLFRNDDSHGVGFLGDAEPGAMTQAKATIEGFALAHWKNTRGRSHSAIPDNYTAVVQRRFRMKYRQEELDRKLGIQSDTGLFINPDGGITLDRDQ